ncbi:DUF262 domain-containing protein [Alkalimonas collagenimarina]|uniref:DUF262 domain-containing protein n=2 Tax=Alkalimonas collagenimarina TaxID=400390 RepID=A0ABT9GUK2_9GAMM|nr:DUF262 domain-containing protein [Alkalimonas collagenimarina]MDP4534701.1 DUF262 domain-containing protein [Alkalimonas collagenimarina]
MDINKVQDQIDANRRSVAFDSYDITIRQLYEMICDEMIDIAPEYQRHFVWDEIRQSQLIESLFLGIPVPSLFMATNKDSTWEVIDGLQRLTTIVNYIGSDDVINRVNPNCSKLTIKGLEKLDGLNNSNYDQLPKSMQLMLQTRPIRVTVLNDRSDFNLRFDLFERLNTGGVTLHPQEIRNCVYIGEFNDFIKECAAHTSFKSVVKMTKTAERQGSYEELVLKFFGYYEKRNEFVHGVKDFLNDYMAEKTNSFRNKNELKELFNETFEMLERSLPDGIVRGNRKNVTPLVLFEAISIGVADAINENIRVSTETLTSLLDDNVLKGLTSGATNSKKRLNDRINYVKDALR